MTKRVGGYIRVSSKGSATKGESLTTQDKAIKDFCKSNGWKLTKIYADEGISGGTVKKRPALQQLLKDVEDGKIDIVVITRLSRIGRNARELLNNYEILKNAGVQLRSIHENMNFNTPVGRVMLTMLSAMAEMEREVSGENTTENRFELARKNIPTSGLLPYGRTYDKKTKEWGLVEGVKVKIQSIAQRYIDGHNMEMLATEMEMYPSNLLKILKDRCSDKWKVSFKGVEVEMTVPRILDDSMIKAVGSRATANNTYAHSPIRNEYLLSRMILCGDCNYPMYGQTDKRGSRSYRHDKKGKNKCKDFGSSVPAAEIEGGVFGQVFEELGDKEKAEAAIQRAIPDLGQIEKDMAEIKDYEKLLKEVSKEKENVLRAIRKGITSDEEAEKDMKDIRQREVLYEGEIKKRKSRTKNIPSESERKLKAKYIERVIKRVYKNPRQLKKMTFDDKRKLMELVFGGKDDEERRLGVYINKPFEKNQKKIFTYTINGMFDKMEGTLPYTAEYYDKLHDYDPNDPYWRTPEYDDYEWGKGKTSTKTKGHKKDKLKVRGPNLYFNK